MTERLLLVEGSIDNENSCLLLLDHATRSSTVLKDPQLTGIHGVGICRLTSEKFLIAGGIRGGVLVDLVFLFDAAKSVVVELARMLEPLAKPQLILIENNVHQIGGLRTLANNQTQETSVYSVGSNSWTKTTPLPFVVSDLKSLLGTSGRIWMTMYLHAFTVYDQVTDEWKPPVELIYSFDHTYPIDSGTFLLVSDYYSTIYEYSVSQNTIVTKLRFGLKSAAHHFFDKDQQAIIWLSSAGDWFSEYHYAANTWTDHGQAECEQLFGKLNKINSQVSFAYASTQTNTLPVEADEKEGDAFKDKAYIFGNWQQPFVIVIDLALGRESARVECLSQDLELKFGIGVCALDDCRILVTGGYQDDFSQIDTSTSIIYDLRQKKAVKGPEWLGDTNQMSFKTLRVEGPEQEATMKNPAAKKTMVIGMDYQNNVGRFTGNEFVPLGGDLAETAVFMDDPDRLLIMCSFIEQPEAKTTFLQFSEYNFTAEKWTNHPKFQTSFSVSINYSFRVGPNQYLILANFSENDETWLGVLSLLQKDNLICGVAFDKISIFNQKYSQLKNFVIGDFILYISYTQDAEGIKPFILNHTTRTLAPNEPRCTAVFDAIVAAAKSIGVANILNNFTSFQKRSPSLTP